MQRISFVWQDVMLGCVWCDVKESWDAEGYPLLTPEELAEEAANYPCNIVVITGGEPAMYDLTALTSAIQKTGKRCSYRNFRCAPT